MKPKYAISRWLFEGQVVPTREDIASVKSLAERLKGLTDAETLNNILEWQERNIAYWRERGYLDVLLKPPVWIGLLFILYWVSIPLAIFSYVLLILRGLPPLASLILSIAIISFLILAVVKAPVLVKLLYVIILSYPVYEFIKVLLLKQSSLESIAALLNLSVINWSIFGISLFTIVYLSLIYNPLARQEANLMGRLKRIFELITLTFKVSLPLSKMLEYKMGICRDYAKLTASLLVNLYPNSKIYFFTIPRHVATGIKLGNRIYILDQKLPLLEPEAWLSRWGVRKAKMFELINKDDKSSIRFTGEISLRQRQPSIFNIKNMFKEIVSEVEKAIKEGRNTASIVLKNATSLFDIDDVIIKESFLRKVRIVLQNEFVSKASKLEETILFKEGNDIILKLRLA